MNSELEALVRAFDAVGEAGSGPDSKRLDALFQSRIDDSLAQHPGLSRLTLLRMVDLQRRRWLRAQQKPTSLPPKA